MVRPAACNASEEEEDETVEEWETRMTRIEDWELGSTGQGYLYRHEICMHLWGHMGRSYV